MGFGSGAMLFAEGVALIFFGLRIALRRLES